MRSGTKVKDCPAQPELNRRFLEEMSLVLGREARKLCHLGSCVTGDAVQRLYILFIVCVSMCERVCVQPSVLQVDVPPLDSENLPGS